MTKRDVHVEVKLAESVIQQSNIVKYFGIMVNENMKWEGHAMHISRISRRNIGIINRSRHFLNREHRKLLYNALVLPYLNYCYLLWGTASKSTLHRLTILQKKIIRIIDDQPKLTHSSPIFANLNMLKLYSYVI